MELGVLGGRTLVVNRGPRYGFVGHTTRTGRLRAHRGRAWLTAAMEIAC